MSLLEALSRRDCWEKFYEYKTSLACPKAFAAELRVFIDEEGYLPVCRRIAAGEGFPLPRKSIISKLDTQKKRVVYTYPRAENTVLKLLTWLLLGSMTASLRTISIPSAPGAPPRTPSAPCVTPPASGGCGPTRRT